MGSYIAGTASDEVKDAVRNTIDFFADAEGFGQLVYSGIRITDVSIIPKREERQKQEAQVVCSLVVNPSMINGMGTLHGACSAFIVDLCSTLAISAYGMATTGDYILNHVTQSLNLSCHSPAVLGDELRIFNTTVACGARALSARTEIWNVSKHRLVASGTHTKMMPSTTVEVVKAKL